MDRPPDRKSKDRVMLRPPLIVPMVLIFVLTIGVSEADRRIYTPGRPIPPKPRRPQ